MACELLPRRRQLRAAFLFLLARDKYAATEFSRSHRVRKAALSAIVGIEMTFARPRILAFGFLLVPLTFSSSICAQGIATNQAPAVTRVDPPNWWINLTPDLMLLLSGHDLQATQLTCNVPEVVVSRTQAAHQGDYLFVWLKFSANMRSGTLVCRIATRTGNTTFELPVATRVPTASRFHGLLPDDVLYLIMPDRF